VQLGLAVEIALKPCLAPPALVMAVGDVLLGVGHVDHATVIERGHATGLTAGLHQEDHVRAARERGGRAQDEPAARRRELARRSPERCGGEDVIGQSEEGGAMHLAAAAQVLALEERRNPARAGLEPLPGGGRPPVPQLAQRVAHRPHPGRQIGRCRRGRGGQVEVHADRGRVLVDVVGQRTQPGCFDHRHSGLRYPGPGRPNHLAPTSGST
jgi:hypothetical protein